MASAATGSPESTASTEEVAVSSQPVRGSAWRRAVGTLALAVLLTACTATHEGQGHRAGPGSAASPSSPSSDTAQPSCPASYVPPRADRPRVALTFAVAPDLATVRGTERITFTPDRSITELVFRLTANTAPTAATGTKIVVTSAQADPAAGDATFSPDGADPSTAGRPAAHSVPATAPCGHPSDRRPGVHRDPGRRFIRPHRARRSVSRPVRLVRLGPSAPRLGVRVRLAYRAYVAVRGRERDQRSHADRPHSDGAGSGHRARLGQPHDWRTRRRHADLAHHLGRGAGRERGRRPLPGQRHQSRFSGAAGRRTQH